MSTLNPATAPTPSMAPWEKITVGLLAVAGIALVFTARANLAERRETASIMAGQRLREIEQAKSEGARLVRESELAVQRLRAVATAEANPRFEVRPANEGAAGSDPAAWTAALSQVVDLMQKSVLSTPPSLLMLNQAARPGQTLPAYMIDAQGKLAPGFGALFGLSTEEVSRLQTVVSDLKQRADELVTSHTTIRQTEDGYVMEYKPAAEAAGFRESATVTLKSFLGEERYHAFAVLNGERVADNGTRTGGPAALFDTMGGGAARTITLARTPTGLRYTMVGEGSSGGGSISGGDLAPVLARFGPAAQLIPQDFINSIPKAPVRTAPAGDSLILRAGEKVIAPDGAATATEDRIQLKL